MLVCVTGVIKAATVESPAERLQGPAPVDGRTAQQPQRVGDPVHKTAQACQRC